MKGFLCHLPTSVFKEPTQIMKLMAFLVLTMPQVTSIIQSKS